MIIGRLLCLHQPYKKFAMKSLLKVKFRFMDIFKKVNGRWQCIASQNTRIGKI